MKKVNEYNVTNNAYGVVLDYIKFLMKEHSGRVVQSYIHCLDSIYNNNHIYVCSSMYSEFGEYLIAYTYTRLLSGSRLMYVVSDKSQIEGLKKYILKRLMNLSDSTDESKTWRVYSGDDRLDQADVFIASPDDFKTENIIEHYPKFFEELSNAIFIDADKVISLDSYLCLVMATRLNNATDNRIRYIFLTTDMIRGFAQSNLPRFFNVEKVSTFSSEDEYEKVSYTLWNRESSNNRIYNKHGQTLTSIDCLIADEALKPEYGIDGIRIISNAPMEHADIDNLRKHGVEFNEFYKTMPDVNYMIYSDDHFNLAATLYACTRFRGKKVSYANIISKPYLLREYFFFKASSENYIIRSAFIQPRVVEHAENYKLILLRIFAEASQKEGMPLNRFILKMQNIINDLKMSNESTNYLTKRCSKLIEECKKGEIKVDQIPYQKFIEFIISAFCDTIDTPYDKSAAVDIKPFYLIIDPDRFDGYTLVREKSIIFKHVDQVYEKLFECNKRVQLSLNGEIIGSLDTFPSRVRSQYIPGQCFVYNNTEYEIERISSNNELIFLRRENVRFKNTLDTIFLRKFDIKPIKNEYDEILQYDQIGKLSLSKGNIESIVIVPFKARVFRETFGYYTLTSDHQTLDFEKGVIGNTDLAKLFTSSIYDKDIYPDADPYRAEYNDSRVLKVTIKSRIELNDGVRLLLSTVMNEFIKTIFPHVYHCIAIVPMLKDKIEVSDSICEFNEQVKSLYPFLYYSGKLGDKDEQDNQERFDEQLVEHSDFEASFYFINDCIEDIGALDWFYDKMGHYVHEFLTNVYSYVYWLSRVPDFEHHYIYFGGKKLPECYDLPTTCELLSDCNVKLSYEGVEDYDTAGEDSVEEELERCAFCHKVMESGRFKAFDEHRYICNDCFDVVTTNEELNDIVISMQERLQKIYPSEQFGRNLSFALCQPFELNENQLLSEYNYKIDYNERKTYIEMIPKTNVEIAVLRAMITFWQIDNELNTPYSKAHCYFEELKYLTELGREYSVEWIRNHLDSDTSLNLQEIESNLEANEELTSFALIRSFVGTDIIDDTDYTDEDVIDGLYDPLQTPRFWKRYLRGDTIDNGEEEIIGDPEEELEEDINTEENIDSEEYTEDNPEEYTEEDSPEEYTEEDNPEEDLEDNLEEDTEDNSEEDLEDNLEEDTEENTEEDSEENTEEEKLSRKEKRLLKKEKRKDLQDKKLKYKSYETLLEQIEETEENLKKNKTKFEKLFEKYNKKNNKEK